MKPTSPGAIGESDLQDFLSQRSDFAFEMRVLKALRDLGFKAEHGGSYRDDVTDKIRQFDIRAVAHTDEAVLALAVECKSFHESNPLLVSTVPRTAQEAVHSVIVRTSGGFSYSTSQEVSASRLYPAGSPVGKHTDNVQRDSKNKFVGNARETFERVNQAINSSRDLCVQLWREGRPPHRRLIVPVLVVPAGRLWQVDYSDDGAQISEPRSVNHVSVFLGLTWKFRELQDVEHHISHVDIVTADYLGPVTARMIAEGHPVRAPWLMQEESEIDSDQP